MYEVFYFLEIVVFRNVSLFHVLHKTLFFKLKKDLSFHFEKLKQSVLTLLKFTLHLLWRAGSDSGFEEAEYNSKYSPCNTRLLTFPEESSCPCRSVRET